MASDLDRATLVDECRDLNEKAGGHWKAEQGDGLRAYVTLSPAGSSDLYCLRLDFGDRLEGGPPSVTFCNPVTHAEGQLSDWPRAFDEYFKTPPNNGAGWICNPWTREGRQHHPEWGSQPWRASRAVWRVTMAVQDILDRPGRYVGRAG
jgi:hypothetical protein